MHIHGVRLTGSPLDLADRDCGPAAIAMILCSAAISKVLAQPLGLDPKILAVVLLSQQGTVFQSEESPLLPLDPKFPTTRKLETKVLALLAAEADLAGKEWVGITLDEFKLCVASIGKLILLVVSTPDEGWGLLSEMTLEVRKALSGIEHYDYTE